MSKALDHIADFVSSNSKRITVWLSGWVARFILIAVSLYAGDKALEHKDLINRVSYGCASILVLAVPFGAELRKDRKKNDKEVSQEELVNRIIAAIEGAKVNNKIDFDDPATKQKLDQTLGDKKPEVELRRLKHDTRRMSTK